nr:transposase [Desulfosporosinus metallidurans]
MVSRFFKNAGCVVEYLGRYADRVALSSNHILKIEDDLVTFKWRDYKDHSKQKKTHVLIRQ